MFNVQFSDYFNRDLQSTEDYIIEKFRNPQAAADLLDGISEKIDSLMEYPYLYPVYTPLKKLENEYRSFTVGNYLVLYLVEDYVFNGEEIKNVVIEAILNQRQNTFQTMKVRERKG